VRVIQGFNIVTVSLNAIGNRQSVNIKLKIQIAQLNFLKKIAAYDSGVKDILL
jgi:hypothetical protein